MRASSPFLQIHAFVADHPEVCHGTAMLYGYLNSYSYSYGFAYASNKRLSELCRCSERTIKYWLSTLDRLGFIKIFSKQVGLRRLRVIFTSMNFHCIPEDTDSLFYIEKEKSSKNVNEKKSVSQKMFAEGQSVAPAQGQSVALYIDKKKYIRKKEREKKESSAAASPHPSSQEKEKEERVYLAENVKIKKSELKVLEQRSGGQKSTIDAWVEKLSNWKHIKGFKGHQNDFKSLLGWAKDAVEEDKNRPADPAQRKIQNNQEFAKKLESLDTHRVRITSQYVEFIHSPSYSTYIGFNENGFREQVINTLRKMNLPTGGL